MAGFTSRDDLINEITVNGKQDTFNFYKIGSAPEAAGVWHTFWTATGNPGAGTASAGATPGTVYASDSASPLAGTMFFPDRDPDLRYLLSFGAVATQNCTLMLYDRLAGVNVSLASASQTLNSGALTRYSGTAATLNQAWLELTVASTAAGANIGLSSYTSADGSNSLVAPNLSALPAAATNVGAMVQLPLRADEQGVRSVETLAVGTTATAAVANVLIIRPLARIPLLANIWNEVSFLDDTMGLPRIYDNAALGLAMLASAATATTVWGTINCAYG
jgi:hypothetical protein